MGAFLSFFVTPALVSLIVSLWAGKVLEERRARRDHITKLFEGAREDVRRGVEVGMDYFATPPKDRSALQEAKVIAADRELRSAVSLLLDKVRSPGCAKAADASRQAFQTLLIELTGDTFQAADGEISREHITRLVHAGAKMRTSLARLRDAELKDRSEQDPIMRKITGAYEFSHRHWPFRNQP